MKDIEMGKSMKTSDIKLIKCNDRILITMLPLLSMLMAIVSSVFHNNRGTDTVKIGILTLLLTGVAVFYIRMNSENVLNKKLAQSIITFAYLISIGLLLFIPNPEIFSFWMIGGLLVAMLVDIKLGLLLHFNLSFLMGIAITMNLETTIQVLILGTVMCMLAGALKQKSTVIYAAIIILSMNITVAFVIHNFVFNTTSNYNYFLSLLSLFLVLTTAYFLSMPYSNAKQSEKNQTQGASVELKNEELAVATEPIILSSMEVSTHKIPIIEEDITDLQLSHVTRTSYDVLCDPENELIQKIKQHSESLYEHAVLIGELSYRAATEIGANGMLAMAGGLYHEVGKIKGKNYIEEGLLIAEEYAFPNDLKAILKEHNIKYEKPGSVEAAIVMLSDNIVATLDYIEKNDKNKYLPNKLIENIFQMRMEKGTLDSSSISVKDYKKLKEFYQKEFATVQSHEN